MAKMTWTKKGNEPLEVTGIVMCGVANDGTLVIMGNVEHVCPDTIRLVLTRRNLRTIIAMTAPMNLEDDGDDPTELGFGNG